MDLDFDGTLDIVSVHESGTEYAGSRTSSGPRIQSFEGSGSSPGTKDSTNRRPGPDSKTSPMPIR